jgi:uncharacterized protein YcnI
MRIEVLIMRFLFSLALVFATTIAQSHVVIVDREAIPGITHAALFRVGHGCGDSPTTSLRIEIPSGVMALSAVPEQGWTMSIARQRNRITSVTWSNGYLPPKIRAGFGILLRLPEKPATLYFPTTQTCLQGINRWTEIPARGQAQELKYPAPSLTVVPKDQKPTENRGAPPVPDAMSHHHH